jgi:hypothetical protein
VMKLICSLGHCECDGHILHKLSQMCFTADSLAQRESDYSRMHSKVSSDLLLYIRITSRTHDRFSRYSKWLDTFRTDPVCFIQEYLWPLQLHIATPITARKTKCSTRIQKYQQNVRFSRFNRRVTSDVLTHITGLSLLLFVRG